MPERQSKATQGRHERMLLELLKLPGNDRCADCGSRNPRWASYSLGIFLCIRCAGLHRKMGTHVSRVKSVTMDEWSLEQIDMMRKGGGNDKVNLSINPHPDRNAMPVGDDEGDRALERYIRNKWEKRAFVDKPIATPPPVPSPKIAAPMQNFPKRSSSVPVVVRDQEEYSASMAKLFEMGFRDTERNRQVLRHTKGSLSAAVDILSRLSGAQKPVPTNSNNNNNNQPVTMEDKLLRLHSLGFINVAANQDALRRSGGNYEVAVSILEGQKKQQQNTPDIASAFSNSPSSNNELAGRAQNILERQKHTLSGGKTGVLLDLESTTTATVTSNPFHMSSQPIQQQQQQQQPIQQPIQQHQPSFFAQPTTNPFGQSPSPSMTMSSSTPSTFNVFAQSQQQSSPAFSNISLQPQLTGIPSPAQSAFMQPQLTGMPVSHMASAVQPQVTGMPSANNNPFSQMTNAPTTTTLSHSFSDRYQMPQRSNTTPDFPTFLHQHQQQQLSSPFAAAASPLHQQIPQQQQQQQQQQHPSLITNTGFPNMVPAQPTGFVPAATAGVNANPWASSFF